jgi:hypothetical protein
MNTNNKVLSPSLLFSYLHRNANESYTMCAATKQQGRAIMQQLIFLNLLEHKIFVHTIFVRAI